MASKPEVRYRIIESLLADGGAVVRERSAYDLRDRLGMSDVSITQFCKALRSLHYKYGYINLYRNHQFRFNVEARSGLRIEAIIRNELAAGVRYANSDEDLAKRITGDPTRSSLYPSVLEWLRRMIGVRAVTVSQEPDDPNADSRFPTKQVRAYRHA